MIQKFIVFVLGEEEFGIEIKSIVEILKSQKICVLPRLPDFISGVITVRGDVIPLIDMRRRLGTKSLPKKERIIVVRLDAEKVGLIVDDIREITGFLKDEIVNPPSVFKGLSAEYLNGIGKKKDRMVVLLSLKNLLSSEEKIMLKASKEEAQI